MKSPIALTRAELVAERPEGVTDDVHFASSLARLVIEAYSREGDLVLDPFVGFGTTAVVAVSMGRRAVAVELLEDRGAIVRRRIGSDAPGATVVVGDAQELSRLVSEPVDLCLTSPPYMSAAGHPENPLTGYRTRDAEYGTYLAELEDVFRQVADLLRRGGRLVVNVADVVQEGQVTPLTDDLSARISRHLAFREEIAISWDVPPPGVTNDCLLVFEQRRPQVGRVRPGTSSNA